MGPDQMAGQGTGADHEKRRGVRPCEIARSEGGRAGGAPDRQGRAVEDRLDLAVCAVINR